MNPYTYIIRDYYGDPSSKFDLNSAALLLLNILAASYTGTMPAGSNPYRWALEQLSAYAPNDFLNKLTADWHSKADPHV
jgi:hypothetical protein